MVSWISISRSLSAFLGLRARMEILYLLFYLIYTLIEHCNYASLASLSVIIICIVIESNVMSKIFIRSALCYFY